MTSSVKFGQHKRYQDWFQEKYFSTPESHSLRSDLIRFIINAIHPTNELLSSDITPRWAIIGWLLTSCTNHIVMANAKLALFYDWLFFDSVKDNIMNVEPGILVMYHSIRNHPFVSATLLDFLCRVMKNFFPKNEEKIRAGVYNSLRKILEKQVIPNLHPLFESSKLDRELKQLIRENFREFCSGPPPPNDFPSYPLEVPAQYQIGDDVRQLMGHNSFGDIDKTTQIKSDGNSDTEPEAKFSDEDDEKEVAVKNEETDDDDDLPLSKVRLKEKPMPDKVQLPASISDTFEKFLTAKTTTAFDAFLSDLRTCTTNMDSEQESYLVDNMVSILKSSWASLPSFPETKNDEKLLQQSISCPIYGVFRVMHQYEEKCKKCFQNIIRQVSRKLPMVGFSMLYFLKVHTKLQSRKNPNGNVVFKANIYKMICDYVEQKLEGGLAKDLAMLEEESTPIFLWLLPDIFREFKTNMINNSDVLRILLGCVDAKNLRDIIYNVTQGKLVIFKNEGVLECVRDSLCYETFEQIFLWQLVQAHNVPVEFLQVNN